jgi:hypothetical protein
MLLSNVCTILLPIDYTRKVLFCLPDAVLHQHGDANVTSIHKIMADHLKQAPHRTGGAGTGCHLIADLANKTSLETSDMENESNDSDEELRSNGGVSDDEDETRESNHSVRTNPRLIVDASRASLENSGNGTEHSENDNSECDEELVRNTDEIPENVSDNEDGTQQYYYSGFSECGDAEESDNSGSVH